ncbi:hypothetical protein ACU81Q_10200 [Komagataeibacter melomenusus]
MSQTRIPMHPVPIQSCEDVETAACIRNLEDGSDLDWSTFNSRLLPEGEWTDVVRRADMEVQIATVMAEKDAQIRHLQTITLPDEMTPDIESALGTICFRAAPYAHAFRKAGAAIPAKAEAEQAFVIFKLLKGVLQHGSFEKAADILLEEAHAAIKKSREG